MKLRLPLLMLCCSTLLFSTSALAVFVFRVGDTVYVDGKAMPWEDWKKIRDNPELVKKELSGPDATPASGPRVLSSQPAETLPAGAPRAATCTTGIYYDEFPSEDEKFQCTAGLGTLTRQQILEKGWKVDFVEKLPPLPGQPAQSTRGLPLNLYKLVISR